MFVLVADNGNVLRVALARNDVVCFLAPDWLRATGVELRVTARRANCATKEKLYKTFAIPCTQVTMHGSIFLLNIADPIDE